jgi:mannose-1-phosphate guanylyltransferase
LDNPKNYALIMAGGSGTRLWPLSRSHRPKQALKLVGERTMIQQAVDRIMPLIPAGNIFVVTRAEHAAILSEQVPELPKQNFIVEPEGRGTAPAIGLGAIHFRRLDPGATMMVLTADHVITGVPQFQRVLSAASQAAGQGYLVTLGIQPSSPFTGYGYIHRGDSLGEIGGFPLFRLERFTEKPDRETARQMLASGEYSWNSGMFVWRVDLILDEFRRQMPEFYTQLAEVEAALGKPEYIAVLGRIWPQVTKQSIDYGVMEGAHGAAVFPVDIGWYDIGSWTSLLDLLPADADGNTIIGSTLGIDTHNTLIYCGGSSGRLIATIGVEDLVIVDTEDALLICPKAREQEVKEVVNRLEKENLVTWL